MKTAAELTAEVGIRSTTASGDAVIMTFTALDRLIDLVRAEPREALAEQAQNDCSGTPLQADLREIFPKEAAAIDRIVAELGYPKEFQAFAAALEARKETQQSGPPHQDLEGGPPGSGGWQAHAEEMQRQRDYFRESLQTIQAHKNGDCWYWQGDGYDHPASMAGSMPVVIRADQLRALIAPVPAQEIVALMPLTRELAELKALAAPAQELVKFEQWFSDYLGPLTTNLEKSAMRAAWNAALATAPRPAQQEPVAWTLTEELEKRETTTRAHLWFSDPVNCMWTPLYITHVDQEETIRKLKARVARLEKALAEQQEPVACPTCGEHEPRTGACGTSPNDKRALCNRGASQPAPVQQILLAFPLLDDNGLDEEKHHCEWALQQDRKRLHAMLAAAPQPAQQEQGQCLCKDKCLNAGMMGQCKGL